MHSALVYLTSEEFRERWSASPSRETSTTEIGPASRQPAGSLRSALAPALLRREDPCHQEREAGKTRPEAARGIYEFRILSRSKNGVTSKEISSMDMLSGKSVRHQRQRVYPACTLVGQM